MPTLSDERKVQKTKADSLLRRGFFPPVDMIERAPVPLRIFLSQRQKRGFDLLNEICAQGY
jgi:hypothetical protein